MTKRRKTRQIKIGDVPIGGDAPISVQSMTNTDTRMVEETVAQIHRLEAAGCELIRVAVVDLEAAEAIQPIRDKIHSPLIADIHFDHRLAVASMENGAQAIRINPGNIGGSKKLAKVVDGMNDIRGDVRDLESLKKSLCESQADIVIHMAAQPLVHDSYKFPVETYSTNVMGTVNILEAARLQESVRAVLNITRIDSDSLGTIFHTGNCQPVIKMNISNKRNTYLLQY